MATDSCDSQQLICGVETDTLQLMVANQKSDFAERLLEACKNARPPIAEGRGMIAELRRRVLNEGLKKVSPEAVRKWLGGEVVPSMDNVRFIAKALNVDTDWLLTGRQNIEAIVAATAASMIKTEEPQPMAYHVPEIEKRRAFLRLEQSKSLFGEEAVNNFLLILDIMQQLDTESQRDVVGAARIALANYQQKQQKSSKRAGQQ